MGISHCTLACLGLSMLMACTAKSYQEQLREGQREVLDNARPVAAVLAGPQIDARTRRLLVAAVDAREFASRRLALPDGPSYRSYVDLHRDYAMWNLFAAGEFSVEPHRSCFADVGCLGYLGYYHAGDAERAAAELQEQGLETYIGTSESYMIPGRNDAPILSTMLGDEGHLAELIFHELTHQRLYVAGDTAFNESLANYVQQEGLRQWQAAHGRAPVADSTREQREMLTKLVLETRVRLQSLYASGLPAAQMRERKSIEFQRLRVEYHLQVAQRWGGKGLYDGWVDAPLNNASLAPFGIYDQWVPAFAALYRQVGGDWTRFFASASALASQPSTVRLARLGALRAEALALRAMPPRLAGPG